MQCTYCHSFLDYKQIKSKDLLKLCCGVNQIFCYNCLFSPTIIQSWIVGNIAVSCQECKNYVDMTNLLRKRIMVNIGVYRQGQLQFGYTYFSKPTAMNSPPRSNYCDMFQIDQKWSSTPKQKTSSSLFETADSEKQTDSRSWKNQENSENQDYRNFTPMRE